MSQSRAAPFPVLLSDVTSEAFTKHLRYLGSEEALRVRCAGMSEADMKVELQTRTIFQLLERLGRSTERQLLESFDEFCDVPESWMKLALAALYFPGLPRTTAASDEEALSWLKFATSCYQLIRREPEKHWPVPLSTVPNLGTWPLKVPASGGDHWLTDPSFYHSNPVESNSQVNAHSQGGAANQNRQPSSRLETGQIGVRTSAGDQEEHSSSRRNPPANATADARPAHAPAAGNPGRAFPVSGLPPPQTPQPAAHTAAQEAPLHIDSHPSGLQATEEGGMTVAQAEAVIDELDGRTALAAIKFAKMGESTPEIEEWTVKQAEQVKKALKVLGHFHGKRDAADAPHGRSQVRIPSPPDFSGKDVTPRDLQRWLSTVKLRVSQLQPPDTVLYAVNFLVGDAATWRDLYLAKDYPGLSGIPLEVFVQALMQRFIPVGVALEAERLFNHIQQKPSQTVEQYNAEFQAARDELLHVPYVSTPDLTSQIKVYLKGLQPSIQRAIRYRISAHDMADLVALMQHAVDAEHVSSSLTWFAEPTKQNASSRSVGVHNSVSATPAPAQKRNHSKGGAMQSPSAKRPRHGKGPSDSGKARASLPSFDQHLASNPRADRYGVAGANGRRYPNIEAVRHMEAHNRAARKCIYCWDSEGPHDWKRGACPNPIKVSAQSSCFSASAQDPQPVPAVAPADVLPDSSIPAPDLTATIAAQSGSGLTMLFAGTAGIRGGKGQGEELRILADSGSSHCVLSDRHSKLAVATGKQFDVTFADGSRRLKAAEAMLSLTVQKYSASIPVLIMPTAPDFDVILGLDWMRPHQAELLIAQDKCKLVDADGVAHCWQVPESLRSDDYNVHVNMVSSSRSTSAVSESFLILVTNADLQAMCNNVQKDASTRTQSDDSAEGSPTQGSLPPDACTSVPTDFPALIQPMSALLEEYSDVFPETVPSGLPPERSVAHAIPTLPDAKPPVNKMYRLSWAERQELERQIKELLAKGWIQPSTSPYGAPVLFVRKKYGGFRMCVDYRALNKQTVRNNYPLPRIDDMLDSLSGATCFSCLDLQQAYHQVRLAPEDVPKTAFTTPLGLFEYRVLSFGLTNAPATFQALINSILGPELSRYCLVYLDDIVVFSPSPEEHMRHLRAVLQRLREHQLFAKASKCRFAQRKISFLGHEVSAEGIAPDGSKVQVVKDWPTPRNVKDLRSFMGLAQYFRKFIQGFSTLTAPLTSLFRKGATWKWAEPQHAAFMGLKHALTSAPVLKLPDPGLEFSVVSDASSVGVGAVLMQSDLPVAYEGRKLTDTELKWATVEQEMLGVVYALTKWRCYLEGRHFMVITDHQPNIWFDSQKRLSPRQAR